MKQDIRKVVMWAIEHRDDHGNFWGNGYWNGTISGALLFHSESSAIDFAAKNNGKPIKVTYEVDYI